MLLLRHEAHGHGVCAIVMNVVSDLKMLKPHVLRANEDPPLVTAPVTWHKATGQIQMVEKIMAHEITHKLSQRQSNLHDLI